MRGTIGNGSRRQRQHRCAPSRATAQCRKTCVAFSLEPFLKNLISLRQSGLLDLNANLSTSGNSQRAWIDGSNGDANFLLNDGVLVDANLSSSCAAASPQPQSPEQDPRGKDTP
jgi:AsmA protein